MHSWGNILGACESPFLLYTSLYMVSSESQRPLCVIMKGVKNVTRLCEGDGRLVQQLGWHSRHLHSLPDANLRLSTTSNPSFPPLCTLAGSDGSRLGSLLPTKETWIEVSDPNFRLDQLWMVCEHLRSEPMMKGLSLFLCLSKNICF